MGPAPERIRDHLGPTGTNRDRAGPTGARAGRRSALEGEVSARLRRRCGGVETRQRLAVAGASRWRSAFCSSVDTRVTSPKRHVETDTTFRHNSTWDNTDQDRRARVVSNTTQYGTPPRGGGCTTQPHSAEFSGRHGSRLLQPPVQRFGPAALGAVLGAADKGPGNEGRDDHEAGTCGTHFKPAG